MSEHSIISPSNANRAINCPGSIQLGLNVKDLATAEATKGSSTHAYAAVLLSWCLGKPMKSAPELETLKAKDIDYFSAKYYCNQIQQLLYKHKNIGENGPTFVEETVEIIPGIMKGTADFVAIFGKNLYIVDLKTGYNVVDPAHNAQLLLYAKPYLEKYDIGKIFFLIIQPTADLTLTWSPTVEDAQKEIDELVNKLTESWSYYKAGADNAWDIKEGDWCQFCKAFNTCPLKKKKISEVIEVQALDTDITLEKAAHILDHESDIKKYLVKIKAFLMDELANGKTVEGYYLKEKMSRRDWDEEKKDELKKFLVDEFGEEFISDFHEIKLKSPAQIEKTIHQARDVKLAEAKSMMKEFTTRNPAGFALVKEKAINEFDKIEVIK